MTHDTAAHETDQAFKIEQRGIDIVPDSERHGNPIELFWIWAASLMGIVDLVIGAVVISLGLSLWAAVAAVIIGNLSYFVVGLVAMNGPAAGTSTIVISRAAFGVRGNAVPTLFSWMTIVCWEGVNAVVGTLALIGIFASYGLSGTGYEILSLIVFLSLMVTWAIFGHATITVVNKLMTYIIGVAMCIVLAYGFQHVNWHYGWGHLVGTSKVTTFVLAVMIVAAANGFAFSNMPADYSRYLPRNASRSRIAWYTALGAFLPATILNGAGAIIGTKLNAFDPVDSLAKVVPGWFHFLFLLIAIVSMVWANIINTYSSGLNLQAMGIRVARYKTVLIDAVVAAAFVSYALWISNFVTSLENFLALMIWWIAPWTAIYLVDMFLRRYRYASADLLAVRSGGIYWYRDGINWRALAALVLGAAASLLFTNATLFASPLTTGPLGGMDFSIPAGMIVGGGAYYLLARAALARAAAGGLGSVGEDGPQPAAAGPAPA